MYVIAVMYVMAGDETRGGETGNLSTGRLQNKLGDIEHKKHKRAKQQWRQ